MLAVLKYALSVLVTVLSVLFPSVYGAEETTKNEDCLLNFAVISDIHMTDETARRDILKLGLLDMQSFSEPFDALVLAGDMTDHANRPQYEMLAEAFEGTEPAEKIIMALGNHDTWNDEVNEKNGYPQSKKLFIEYNKKIADRKVSNVYYSTKVNGYTFIVMGSEADRTDAYISKKQLTWLESELKKADKGDKPIFVISHWPLAETHGLPLTWLDNPLFESKDELEADDGSLGDQNNKVRKILKKYDDVFLISGHLHNGASTNSIYGYSSVETHDGITSINLPSFMYLGSKSAPTNGVGFTVEVYKNEVVIRTRCFTSGAWYLQKEFTVEL